MSAPRAGLFWLRHMWRDEVVRSMPVWLVVTALNTSVATGALTLHARVKSVEISAMLLLVVLWAAISLSLIAGRSRARCSRLDLTLPLTARQLWLSHLGATVLAGLGALAASVGVVIAHERLVGLGFGWQRVLGPAIAGLVLVAVLAQSYRPTLRQPPRGRFNSVLLLSLSLVLSLLLLFARWPLAAALVTAVVALGVGARAWAALEGGLLLVPTDLSPPVSRSVSSPSTARRSSEGQAASSWTLFSIFHHAPPWGRATAWVLYGFVAAIGFVMAGGLGLFSDFYDERVLRTIYLPLASYGLFSGIGVLLYQSFRVEPLPVSRMRLFTLLMVPTLTVFLVFFAATRALLAATPPPQLVEYRVRGESKWVDVPVRFLSISSGSQVPQLEAPWGEAHAAWNAPLFKGGETVLYSPFNTSEATSPRFEAWLMSRAIEAVYAESIPADGILERYFRVENGQVVGLADAGLTLLADYPQLTPPDDGPETPVYLTLILVPWLLAVALFFRVSRPPSTEKRLKRAFWTLMILLLAVMLAQAGGMLSGVYNAEVATGVFGILVRQLGASSFAVVVTWLLAVVCVGGSYLLAQRQFEDAELPARPVKLSLIDFAPGDS